MDRQPTSGRGIAVKTFLIISLLVIAVPLTYILFPFGSMTIAKATSLDFLFLLLMMAPNLLLALWTGFFLGPRLSSVGYLRSVVGPEKSTPPTRAVGRTGEAPGNPQIH